MFNRLSVSICAALALMFLVACSGQNFVVVRDGSGAHAGTTLGMRSVADVRALAPTDKLSWLEYCKPEVTTTLNIFTSTDYVNCQLDTQILPAAKNSVSTGYVAGIAGPVLQAGAIVGGAALIGNGISKSGSRTTNNNSTTGGSATNSNANSNNANGGQGGNGGNGQGGHGGHGGGGQGGDGGNEGHGNNGNHNGQDN